MVHAKAATLGDCGALGARPAPSRRRLSAVVGMGRQGIGLHRPVFCRCRSSLRKSEGKAFDSVTCPSEGSSVTIRYGARRRKALQRVRTSTTAQLTAPLRLQRRLDSSSGGLAVAVCVWRARPAIAAPVAIHPCHCVLRRGRGQPLARPPYSSGSSGRYCRRTPAPAGQLLDKTIKAGCRWIGPCCPH